MLGSFSVISTFDGGGAIMALSQSVDVRHAYSQGFTSLPSRQELIVVSFELLEWPSIRLPLGQPRTVMRFVARCCTFTLCKSATVVHLLMISSSQTRSRSADLAMCCVSSVSSLAHSLQTSPISTTTHINCSASCNLTATPHMLSLSLESQKVIELSEM